ACTGTTPMRSLVYLMRTIFTRVQNWTCATANSTGSANSSRNCPARTFLSSVTESNAYPCHRCPGQSRLPHRVELGLSEAIGGTLGTWGTLFSRPTPIVLRERALN